MAVKQDFLSVFSPGQVQWMHAYANIYHNTNFHKNYFDIYEPNDYKETARRITINEYQTHTLHNRSLVYNYNHKDTDFIKFNLSEVQASGKLKLILEPLPDKTNVDIKLSVYNNENNIVYEIETEGYNISAELPSLLAGDYWIKIIPTDEDPLSFNSCGYYGIIIEECIPAYHCVSGTIIADEHKVFAATNILSSPCADDLSFKVKSGANVIAQSENEIVLLPGFETEFGAEFTAEIVSELSCNTDNKRNAVIYPKIPQIYSFKIDYDCIDIDNNQLNTTTSQTVSIYPNPNHGIFKIDFKSEEEISQLSIYNVSGNLVYNKFNFIAGNEINIQHVQPGIYIMHIKTLKRNYTVKFSYQQ